MPDPTVTRTFLESEVEALEPFGFVRIAPAGEPRQAVEVVRAEDAGLEVRVPGRMPSVPELPVGVRSALRERGFASEDPEDPRQPWTRSVTEPAAAVEAAQALLAEVLGQKPDVALDVVHGSRREEHEAQEKLAQVRTRVEKLVREILGEPAEVDEDGDFVLPTDDVHVIVAPRALPGGPAIVRIFAVTNVGVNVAPELGLLLARLNFGLMFGRFALDTEHRSIWFDETLLGEHFSDEEFRFTVRVVATTADEWDDRLKQMFGGATWQEMLKRRTEGTAPPIKPGNGGYL